MTRTDGTGGDGATHGRRRHGGTRRAALGSFAIHVAERDGLPGTAHGLVGALIGVVALGVVLFSFAAGLGHG